MAGGVMRNGTMPNIQLFRLLSPSGQGGQTRRYCCRYFQDYPFFVPDPFFKGLCQHLELGPKLHKGSLIFVSKPPLGCFNIFWAELSSRRNNGFFISRWGGKLITIGNWYI
ncbi:hypothetical protein [Anaerocolumna jejuensis]|uniref:hypothetical protein n=1 Tax=Anaerocolumna jejuensis TaxID=259063 RepID=UPI003F7B54EB